MLTQSLSAVVPGFHSRKPQTNISPEGGLSPPPALYTLLSPMTPPARAGVRFMSCLLCCTHFSLSPFSFSSLDLHPGSAPSKCLSELLRAEPFSCFKQPTGGCFPLQGQPHAPPNSIEENRDPAFPEGLIWAWHVGSTLHILSHLILTTILGRRY